MRLAIVCGGKSNPDVCSAWTAKQTARAIVVAIIALLVSAAISVPAAAQATYSVIVEGNRRIEADTIRSYFNSSEGKSVDEKIDATLKAMFETGMFEDVKIKKVGASVVIRVSENPVINRVAFEGNKKIKDDQLKGEIRSQGRGSLSRAVVQADVQRIVEIYRRNGRFDARVTPKIIEHSNNRVDLVFEIQEGEKSVVRKIAFVGNNSYGNQRLKDQIKTSETFPFSFLEFLQSANIYDPDRLEADRDLLRRFYLKHGFPDVRITSASAVYHPDQNGFVVTFAIEEGPQYKFGNIGVVSNIPGLTGEALNGQVRAIRGEIYNAEAVEKTIENLSIDVARRGYPFAVVRPTGDRDATKKLVHVSFVIDEGPRVYVERINIRGNTRTRDFVIRREFDIGEGDAYNRALVDRAERRLKNLNYFKTVKISNEPGSSRDRIILNVDVEEMPTGEISLSGGYSTSSGWLAEVSVGERNLLGQGYYGKMSVQYGESARGAELSFADPYFLNQRIGLGIDLFYKKSVASSYVSYDSTTVGTALRASFGLSEEISFQARYSIYRQEIALDDYLNSCRGSSAAAINGGAGVKPGDACYSDSSEASLAVRKELAAGPVLVSMPGYTLAYNALDDNRNPTRGVVAELRQDFAGVGGDVNFLRTSADIRSYRELVTDVVAVLHLQAGMLSAWGGKDLRMLDHFKMGPNLVRGFASAGLGPRDLTEGGSNDALGGTKYWGASVEVQTPFHFIPKDVGIKGTVFADAGSLWDYKGPTSWDVTGETVQPADSASIRASVGVGLIWNSPFGPLRFDYAIPLAKQGYDNVQQFRFGGGTKF